jgi:hypothetical protein
MTSSRIIKTPDGHKVVLSSNDLDNSTLVVAEVLLEMATERGGNIVHCDIDMLARRVRAKGYSPATGKPLH